jgi:hypothetical protein
MGIRQKFRLQPSQDKEDLALSFQSSLVVWSGPVACYSHWQTPLTRFSVPLEKTRTNTLRRTQMTNHFPLLLNKTLSRSQSPWKNGSSETVFKHFLQQSQRGAHPLTIISVYGRSVLDRQIALHAPEETEFIRIKHDLHRYFSNPRFDILFFSLPGRKNDEAELYENLSYSRMLLKPGGSIWLLLEANQHAGYLQREAWKKSMEAAWLTRTGFTQLHRKQIGTETVFLCGSRPKVHF